MENVNRRPLALALTVLGAVARLVPHPWNFAPVGGMSLFAGARLRGWQAYVLPIVLMAVTDPLVGGYSRATPFVYLSFLINVWIGPAPAELGKPAANRSASCGFQRTVFRALQLRRLAGLLDFRTRWRGSPTATFRRFPSTPRR